MPALPGCRIPTGQPDAPTPGWTNLNAVVRMALSVIDAMRKPVVVSGLQINPRWQPMASHHFLKKETRQ